jgi:thiamine-phosphate pyrophosphorylase
LDAGYRLDGAPEPERSSFAPPMSLPVFYPILDTQVLTRLGLGVEVAAEAILEGGAQILQFRHKGLYSREWWERVQRVAELCSRTGAIFVVNDRPDVALLLDAACHVGQEDLPPEVVRRLLGPALFLGYSTHNRQQLLDGLEQPVDYLALGPVFATYSKENPDSVVGVEDFAAASALTVLPLVAIGGITRTNCLQVLGAGADSVAVISDLYPEPCTYAALRARTEEWLQLTAG